MWSGLVCSREELRRPTSSAKPSSDGPRGEYLLCFQTTARNKTKKSPIGVQATWWILSFSFGFWLCLYMFVAAPEWIGGNSRLHRMIETRTAAPFTQSVWSCASWPPPDMCAIHPQKCVCQKPSGFSLQSGPCMLALLKESMHAVPSCPPDYIAKQPQPPLAAAARTCPPEPAKPVPPLCSSSTSLFCCWWGVWQGPWCQGRGKEPGAFFACSEHDGTACTTVCSPLP